MDTENIISYIFFTIGTVVVGVFLYQGIVGRRMLKKRLSSEYQKSLEGTNRQIALEAGRRYYMFLRKGKLTIYDEQAIDNDMKIMSPIEIPTVVNPPSNIVDQLERLAKLKEQGILNEVEFHEQKAKVLGV